jgi:hypothetical protein
MVMGRSAAGRGGVPRARRSITRWSAPLKGGAFALAAAILLTVVATRTETGNAQLAQAPAPATPTAAGKMLEQFCSRCHNDIDMTGKFSMDDLRGDDVLIGKHADEWEKILRRTSLGEMPPLSKPQPDPADREGFVTWLTTALDQYAAAHPDPGRATLRRLNRVEYANAVRDLLDLHVDVSRELPQDNSGYGFDNIADVLSVSPTLMDRYVVVAGKIGRMATGLASPRAVTTSYELPKDGSILNSGRPAYNERASDDLPLGSRGGGAFHYYARTDGTYEVAGWLNSNSNNETDRLKEDRYSVRVPLKAGAHVIGLSFRRQLAPDESVQTVRNDLDKVPVPLSPPKLLPLDVSVDGAVVQQISVPSYRYWQRYSQQNFPRDVLQIDVTGPFDAAGPGDTPSRRAIYLCKPRHASAEAPCAKRIIATLARRAYRRPVTDADMTPLLAIYADERKNSDFEHGVEAAVEAILVSPEFLFVVEHDAAGSAPGAVHRITDLELASRLSLFLWSSIPDETLLKLGEKGELSKPAVLNAQIARMLTDPRAQALTQNFAGQWLFIRNLSQQRPDLTVYPEFDERLRASMARETEMFFSYIVAENRPVTDFIAADYTFLNQRLAEHYGIPGVTGTAFRKVALDPAEHRGGLLGQGSILTVTSYGNHTSVVKRGKWVLDNILAAAPPPPPPNIPALVTVHDGHALTAREQLELHRKSPACAGCHVKMDPLGFALENFDAVGAWRQQDAGQLIDATAVLPDGSKFAGIGGLQQILLARRDQFTEAFTRRLMTYALARGLVATDMPSVRGIARGAAADQYRIQTIIRGIVTSDQFTLRKTPAK